MPVELSRLRTSSQLYDSDRYTLPVCIKPPTLEHTHTVILLHGRDSNSKDFASEFFDAQASDGRLFDKIFPHVKWVFPSSEIRYNERMDEELSQWFDMWSREDFDARPELQRRGLAESRASISSIIQTEAFSVPLDHIILAGIGQGCATAIWTLLTLRLQLGGFIGVSGWLPGVFGGICPNCAENMRGVPVFLSHYIHDNIVPVAKGEIMEARLREQYGMEVEWHCYTDGGHNIDEPKRVDDVVAFLQRVMRE